MNDYFKIDLVLQGSYAIIAVVGGVARYLKGFTEGAPFSFSVFLASAFVSGFGGWLFALVGVSLHLPQPLLFAMAGVGGFFSEQSMKFVYEWAVGKIK